MNIQQVALRTLKIQILDEALEIGSIPTSNYTKPSLGLETIGAVFISLRIILLICHQLNSTVLPIQYFFGSSLGEQFCNIAEVKGLGRSVSDATFK